ncbi:Vegetative incompatibility protein HET-E-1 [Colletotrichum siamense]|uniref:Vegetative incompatibility protein HET-E-1 n=1 Tax=Colletotrichum siamense TaxID=690259 RepID=A0A9P5ESN4_COLSI|nr:Vegetative incompatibility protein HET-E-1 [Colletotrichum siamense]KAF4858624.1 Vegetative incompatibility protein HET-E-1 [Colletotrichum siamense]
MWLINTTTLKLAEFQGGPPSLPYAILSHTWSDGEVSFHDMADFVHASKKPGFTKIWKTCEIARAAGIEWAWVDTCCIDKRSSAELTESINSMFRWYNDAHICYAYLSDYPPSTSQPRSSFFRSAEQLSAAELGQCRWFSRGWTLQELVASRDITFFDKNWNDIGSKAQLQSLLASITGIDQEVLEDPAAVYEVPVARRMSWAARRRTKREEDRAYSLFGIFDVNLPLIYGEGRKAFLRLQEAILQNSTDLSLFAWDSSDDDTQAFRGLLAQSPDEFADGSCLVPIQDAAIQQTEIRITNKGIHFKPDVMLISRQHLERLAPDDNTPSESGDSDATMGRSTSSLPSSLVPEALLPQDRRAFVMKLNHYYLAPSRPPPDINHHLYVCIELFRTPDAFVRRRRWVLEWSRGTNPKIADKREVHIPRHLSPPQSRSFIREADHTFSISCKSPTGYRVSVTTGFPAHLWFAETSTFCTKAQPGFVGMVSIKQKADGDWVTFTRKNGGEIHSRKWHYPDFRVFFGLGRPGSTAETSFSSSSTLSLPPQPEAWVYVPTRADLLLGRSTLWGGYSQSELDNPEGLRHLIRRSWDPSSYAYPPYTLGGTRQAPVISDCKDASGWFLLRAEYEEATGIVTREDAEVLAAKSLEVQAAVTSHRFPSGMTEHRLEIQARPVRDRFDEVSMFSGPQDMCAEYLCLI